MKTRTGKITAHACAPTDVEKHRSLPRQSRTKSLSFAAHAIMHLTPPTPSVLGRNKAAEKTGTRLNTDGFEIDFTYSTYSCIKWVDRVFLELAMIIECIVKLIETKKKLELRDIIAHPSFALKRTLISCCGKSSQQRGN
ncbi:hypothetical protein M758_9G182800 [Ceratodon purpureus]|nr:hypothetical protein M758_9G182800 [Ceratodon purpureus]